MKKSKEVKPSNKWWCETCKSKEMPQAEVIEHLKSIHGLDAKGLKCQKQAVSHMDGDTWFSWQWAITVPSDKGEIKLTNSTVSSRAKDDMMRYI